MDHICLYPSVEVLTKKHGDRREAEVDSPSLSSIGRPTLQLTLQRYDPTRSALCNWNTTDSSFQALDSAKSIDVPEVMRVIPPMVRRPHPSTRKPGVEASSLA